MACKRVSGLSELDDSRPSTYRVFLAANPSSPTSPYIYKLRPSDFTEFTYNISWNTLSPYSKKVTLNSDTNPTQYQISQLTPTNPNNPGSVTGLVYKKSDSVGKNIDFDNSYYPIFGKIDKGLVILEDTQVVSSGSFNGVYQISMLKQTLGLYNATIRNGVLITDGNLTFMGAAEAGWGYWVWVGAPVGAVVLLVGLVVVGRACCKGKS